MKKLTILIMAMLAMDICSQSLARNTVTYKNNTVFFGTKSYKMGDNINDLPPMNEDYLLDYPGGYVYSYYNDLVSIAAEHNKTINGFSIYFYKDWKDGKGYVTSPYKYVKFPELTIHRNMKRKELIALLDSKGIPYQLDKRSDEIAFYLSDATDTLGVFFEDENGKSQDEISEIVFLFQKPPPPKLILGNGRVQFGNEEIKLGENLYAQYPASQISDREGEPIRKYLNCKGKYEGTGIYVHLDDADNVTRVDVNLAWGYLPYYTYYKFQLSEIDMEIDEYMGLNDIFEILKNKGINYTIFNEDDKPVADNAEFRLERYWFQIDLPNNRLAFYYPMKISFY